MLKNFIVGKDDEERLLCPVRALKFYYDRTKSLKVRPRNLFLSPRDTSRPLSKNALSLFLREAIVNPRSPAPYRYGQHTLTGSVPVRIYS